MKKSLDAKKFNKIVMIGILFGMVTFALPTIIIDPYFHYHAPLESLQYPINNERYQNNGIVRHFTYDALVTGTSMTENFKTSEADELFGVHAIKVPLNGASQKEIRKLIETALRCNDDLKIVFRGLDSNMINKDKNYENREAEPGYPHYLYDNTIFNDAPYVLNKAVLDTSKNVIENTLQNGGTDNFDKYASWNDQKEFGKEIVLQSVSRSEIRDKRKLTENEKQMIAENIRVNVVAMAQEYPDTDFYVFIPPWSICWWGNTKEGGTLNSYLEAEKIAIEEMLTCENIKVFSFSNNFEWTCNLDNYTDQCHYGEWINSEMLQLMAEGKYQLTAENYEAYLKEINTFYTNYDYDSIYE